MEVREKGLALGSAFDIVVNNHNKLKGSKDKILDHACNTVLASVTTNPNSILGPISEQLTRSNKKSKRTPYINVAEWIHEKAQDEFDTYIIQTLNDFSKENNDKRKVMGICIMIRQLAIISCGKSIVKSLSKIIEEFTSENPSLFEMELFNTFIFIVSAIDCEPALTYPAIERYSLWFKGTKQIAAVSAAELLLNIKEDKSFYSILPKLRTDIPPSSEQCKQIWVNIVAKPFETTKEWITLGLILGRFEEERLRQEISEIGTERGQFSSIITVALSCNNRTVQNIGRALFRFGIHGREAASFDPSSLSSILEQSDDLTGIALTFLSEMSLANADQCVPQLFPLLHSDKAAARKNALALLQKIVDGHVETKILQMIASNLLPLVGDDAISVRVDIPKLFAGVPPMTIVPPLVQMLSDPSEKKRSTASASLKLIMKTTDAPDRLLQLILDAAMARAAPVSPASIGAQPVDKKAAERALELVEKWAAEEKEKFNLDPAPLLQRLWSDPQNDVIVSFISKASPLFDQDRLLAAVLTKLRAPAETIFDSLSPLLVLRSQPLQFFTRRETAASPLFYLLREAKQVAKPVDRLRGEIIARFSPNFVMPQLIEDGKLGKMECYIICMAGNIHGQPLPDVPEVLEGLLPNAEPEMFEPYADALYFSDSRRYFKFAIQQKPNLLFRMHISAFQKFTDEAVAAYIRSGDFGKLLEVQFDDADAGPAVTALFLVVYKGRECDMLKRYWSRLFDIASYFSDKNDVEAKYAALKLIGALITIQGVEDDLVAVVERLQHILEIRSDYSEDERVRTLASTLLETITPGSKIKVEEDIHF